MSCIEEDGGGPRRDLACCLGMFLWCKFREVYRVERLIFNFVKMNSRGE